MYLVLHAAPTGDQGNAPWAMASALRRISQEWQFQLLRRGQGCVPNADQHYMLGTKL
jgi:hypothetical protein